jgi:hypothetical protein
MIVCSTLAAAADAAAGLLLLLLLLLLLYMPEYAAPLERRGSHVTAHLSLHSQVSRLLNGASAMHPAQALANTLQLLCTRQPGMALWEYYGKYNEHHTATGQVQTHQPML